MLKLCGKVQLMKNRLILWKRLKVSHKIKKCNRIKGILKITIKDGLSDMQVVRLLYYVYYCIVKNWEVIYRYIKYKIFRYVKYFMIVIFCLYLIYYTCCHFHSDNGEEVLMYVIFYLCCCGKCSCLLHMQMVRQAFLNGN